jgi:hypothetical protein
MKTAGHFFICTLALFVLCSCATTQKEPDAKPMNANLIFLDSKINAANSHYKNVLTTIADKQMTAKITKNQSELDQINHDLARLEADRGATEEQMAELIDKYNTALKNK